MAGPTARVPIPVLVVVLVALGLLTVLLAQAALQIVSMVVQLAIFLVVAWILFRVGRFLLRKGER